MNDDTPKKILDAAKELVDYYDAPGMRCEIFESKLYRLGGLVEKELNFRESLTKSPIVSKIENPVVEDMPDTLF